MKHLSPADYVIHMFGGVRATARAIGRTPSAVSLWRAKKKNGGYGGRIPMKSQSLVLAFAHTNAIDIQPQDFKLGRKVHIPKKPVWEQ